MVDKEFARLSIEKANLLNQEQTKDVKKQISDIDKQLSRFSVEEQLKLSQFNE